MTISITVAYGDGDSPEAMEAALLVLREAGAPINLESVEIGQRIYAMDYPQGILPSAFKKLAQTKMLLKGQVIKPQDQAYQEVGEVVREHFMLTDEHRLSLELSEHRAAAYINEQFALFETGDSTLPATLLACILMLEHVGRQDIADNIRQALEKTLAEGLPDTPLLERIFSPKKSEARQWAEAISSSLTADYSKTGS